MKKRVSIFDLFKEKIEKYLKIGLSIRCIYLLIKDELKNDKKIDGNITYQSVRRYILSDPNLSKYLIKTKQSK